MNATHGLNGPQAEAVATLRGPLLVLAGAGTGKTRVVTFRIANLIRNGIAPDRILAVTFTNKAAGEMQERVGELIQSRRSGPKGRVLKRSRRGDDSPKPTISTFHSQCVRILREHARALGYPKKFSIYDRSDQESLARTVLRELKLPGTALKPSDMLAIISSWKNESILPDRAVYLAGTDREHFAAAAYRRYQNALKLQGAMDFDDLLLQTEQLFEEHSEIRDQEAAKYDHVLVDEYQDTNGSQYRITRHLTEKHRNFCVVGDDDQSIYAWRGADVTHILNFKNDWPDAKVVYLQDNYRSTAAILEMANRLIAYNTIRHDKRLIASRPPGKRPRIEQYKDEITESKSVVAQITQLIDNEHVQPRDIAILFRTNEQPRLFETELRKAKVPYVMLGSQSFFDRKEIRDLISYLKWIEQPSDEVSLLRVINTPPRGLGSKTVKTLIGRAVERGVPVWEVMQDPSALTDLPVAARKGISQLAEVASNVRQRAENESLTDAMRTLLDQTAYADEISRNYEKTEEREARMSSIEEMINAIGAYQDGATKPDITGFLSEIALAGREMGNEKDKLAQQNAVWLLTMHAAKGLEFPYVFMVGLEDGILPHSRSVKSGEENDIAEERRLCYVGITRAQEILTLSLALTRRKWGKPRPTTPSRFLYEITGKADNPNQYRKKGGNR
ncbi:MAG: UvrD-helicase domain-containing protein [Rubripirellula sp.]|nr:UvrD-helicase domain-containing protein [Rubripirellula sp.]